MIADSRFRELGELRLAPLFDLVVDLSSPLDFGAAEPPRRILYGATGGSFHGERLRGEVVPGGGDWATLHAGGRMNIDVRLTLRTHDDAAIFMSYGGRLVTPPEQRRAMRDPDGRAALHPSTYYFRTTPVFETGSSSYRWLNDLVSIGSGYLVEGGIAYRIFQIL